MNVGAWRSCISTDESITTLSKDKALDSWIHVKKRGFSVLKNGLDTVNQFENLSFSSLIITQHYTLFFFLILLLFALITQCQTLTVCSIAMLSPVPFYRPKSLQQQVFKQSSSINIRTCWLFFIVIYSTTRKTWTRTHEQAGMFDLGSTHTVGKTENELSINVVCQTQKTISISYLFWETLLKLQLYYWTLWTCPLLYFVVVQFTTRALPISPIGKFVSEMKRAADESS